MFAAIISFALRQRAAILAATAALMVVAFAQLSSVPLDVLPDLNQPTVTVMTEAPGMAPEEVERRVTTPIERAIGGLNGIQGLRSVSGVGLSIVYIRFGWATDIYRGRQLVTERLSTSLGTLPRGVMPRLGPVTSIMGEVMLLALHERTNASPDPMALRDTADWIIRPRLLSISGVSQVTVMGGDVRQYQVRPDPVRMRAVGITLDDLRTALTDFGTNTSGGYVVTDGAEYAVRNLGHTTRVADLRSLYVGKTGGNPVNFGAVSDVRIAPGVKRGDGGFNGSPAVIIAVQKQPGADTIALTREIESSIRGMHASGVLNADFDVVFRQADFIEHSVHNLTEALGYASGIVAVILFLFLLSMRPTLISLAAIPTSLLISIMVFKYLGLSLNTMTIGGLAIAVGELVDDAVVGVENVLRRLRNAAAGSASPGPGRVILDATVEVRSAIWHASLIIVLVFVPLFAVPGMEGRLISALGTAYITSILASLLVSITLTPALCRLMLPGTALLRRPDSPLLATLKRWEAALLAWALDRTGLVMGITAAAVATAALAAALLPATFLPMFNEGTLTVNLVARPGTSLVTSNRIGVLAERLLLEIPDVRQVGRRTGRADQDEHAQGVHASELDVELKPGHRAMPAVLQDVRQRLQMLPVDVNIGQPVSHRLDHLLAGVRADMVVKIFGPDLDTLQRLSQRLRNRLSTVPDLTDLQVEQQGRVPQLQIRLKPDQALQYGLRPATLNQTLATLSNGAVLSQIYDGAGRYDVVLRLPDSARNPQALADLPIATPAGTVLLSRVANVARTTGPGQIRHEDIQRRAVIYANIVGQNLGSVLDQVRSVVAGLDLPTGYSARFEGRFKAQEDARNRIIALSALSLLMIFTVLYNRYRSTALALIVMVNIPLAFIGGVFALWVTMTPLSLPSLVGFITLAGISARNGILKVSHYINLAAREGEPFGRGLIVRGALERLAPVFMTALVAAFALLPLVLAGASPGKELLHPVAVVIFGGLITSTLLDMILTPVLFHRWGATPLRRLLRVTDDPSANDPL